MVNPADVLPLPVYHRATVGADALDVLGHMTFNAYLALFGRAWWQFNASIGLDEEYARTQRGGIFALEHHIRFLAEVNVGETIAIHLRLIGLSAKRIHYIFFMLNETTGAVAALSEGVGSFADLQARRTAPFPAALVERLTPLLAQHAALTWPAPLCGVMRV